MMFLRLVVVLVALVVLAAGDRLAAQVPEALGAAVPLIEAVKAGDAVAASALIDAGADVNRAQADGATALHWAAYRTISRLPRC